ncbi:MAG: hypothetical protein KatS3mg076_2384 [Candidatus Binatia bacterium]|nr:MAG: hypothetical protein KatS3mg076_2384 [Candidatus Binatia bacterium]
MVQLFRSRILSRCRMPDPFRRFDPARAKTVARWVWLNLLVTLALLFSVNTITGAVLAWVERPGGLAGDNRWKLPVYEGNREYARVVFEEFRSTTVSYRPFVGWRRDPFEGVTLRIDTQGRRRTVDPDPSRPKVGSVYFFGGSAMWGTGSDDAHTIPSLFARLEPRYAVENYAETAWNSRQGLDQLVTLYALGHRPDVVVFYDGANDVYHQCTRLTDVVPGHARVNYLREAAKHGRSVGLLRALRALFLEHLIALSAEIQKLEFFRKARGECSTFDCPCDEKKTDLIAQNLLANWQMAKILVEAHGGRFLPVLQPVAFEGRPYTKHLGSRLEKPFGIRPTFRLVYEKIRERLASHPIRSSVLDLTGTFDGDRPFYIDFCHVSPEGNAIVARKIFEHLHASAPKK